ncbi:hypothetical protein Ahy_Scaffold1g106625 isoform G [Arachis hypogaea]|uniref:C2 domain-containing protein n=1 Tax=Arachis hypogaea TaxID=3818 RepID=A0A444WQW6_ARAHY|nr:hypothetical protein Ahy_Scaffold1g106625 isoform G [Arachis hypogaea]
MNLGGKIEGHVSQNLSTSDPYVTVSVSGAVIARSFVIRNSENPVWMQHFNVPVAHHAAEVHFVVKDSDYVGSQIIGAVGIPVERLIDGTKVEGVFPILNASGKPCKHGAVLNLSVQYTHVDKGPITGCPREPWHDLHSRIDGPAAYDILTNFEERWLRAIKMSKLQKMKSSYDDSLLKVDRIADIVGIDQVTSLNGEDNRETWHVQVLIIDRKRILPLSVYMLLTVTTFF